MCHCGTRKCSDHNQYINVETPHTTNYWDPTYFDIYILIKYLAWFCLNKYHFPLFLFFRDYDLCPVILNNYLFSLITNAEQLLKWPFGYAHISCKLLFAFWKRKLHSNPMHRNLFSIFQWYGTMLQSCELCLCQLKCVLWCVIYIELCDSALWKIPPYTRKKN